MMAAAIRTAGDVSAAVPARIDVVLGWTATLKERMGKWWR
jgi:hypothetical protein